MTENEKYGAINRRFDKRVKLLSKFGFRYERTDLGFAVMKRHVFYKPQAIPTATLLFADNQFWRNELANLLKRGLR